MSQVLFFKKNFPPNHLKMLKRVAVFYNDRQTVGFAPWAIDCQPCFKTTQVEHQIWSNLSPPPLPSSSCARYSHVPLIPPYSLPCKAAGLQSGPCSDVSGFLLSASWVPGYSFPASSYKILSDSLRSSVASIIFWKCKSGPVTLVHVSVSFLWLKVQTHRK